MEIQLDSEWLKRLTPLLKASLVAIFMSYRSPTARLPLSLPFPEVGLKENMAKFDLMYKDMSEADDYEIVASLDRWVVEGKAKTWSAGDLLKMKRLVGNSFRDFGSLARKDENRWCWEPCLELKARDGTVAWVAKGSR